MRLGDLGPAVCILAIVWMLVTPQAALFCAGMYLVICHFAESD